MKNLIVTLTGPSASGKSTLERMLVERGLQRVISHTTRAPRSGEVDGVDYHFVTEEQFKLLHARGEFLETAEFANARYGASATEFKSIFEHGGVALVVVEPKGRRQIVETARAHGWETFTIFIDGMRDLLTSRLVDRFVADLLLSLSDQASARKVVESFKRRINASYIDEQGWRQEAYHYAGMKYDYLIAEFSEATQMRVISEIMEHVSKRSLGVVTPT